MATPSETTLRSNVLIRLTNNEYRCCVCVNDVNFTAWEKHISDAEHIATLRQFNSTFEIRRGTSVSCKRCQKFLSRGAVRTHAKSHFVAPWHRPYDCYKQLFVNRVFQWTKQFHCCLCDVTFNQWFVALLHLKEKVHLSRLEKAAAFVGFSSSILISETYESLVLEGFVALDSSGVECKFCRIGRISFGAVTDHIKSFSHSYRKWIYVPKSGEAAENLVPTERINHCPEFRYFTCAKYMSRDAFCNVCNIFFESSEEPTKLHLAEKSHADGLKKYGCENISLKSGDIFHCGCCDVAIPDLKSLRLHIKQKSHASSMLQAEKSKAATPSISSEISRDTRIWIGKRDTNISYCRICETELKYAADVGSHVRANGHVATLAKFGCENILHVDGNFFRCGCCNCRINGHHNVYLHMRGRRHSFSLIYLRRRQREKSATKKSERPEWSKVVSSMVDQLTKLAEQSMPKSSTQKPRSRVNRAFSPEVVERVACNFCDVVVPDSAELHSHMAGHFSGDFVRCRVDENANRRIPDAVKNPAELRKIAESLEKFSGKLGTKDTKGNGTDLPPDAKISDGKSNRLIVSTKHALSECLAMSSIVTGNSDEDSSDDETRYRLKRTRLQRIARTVDFSRNYIYNMKDRLRDIERGMRLCMVVDSGTIYCLVCRKIVVNTLQNYFEHLRSLDHVDYLESMENDHRLFELATGQFSELDLADHYIEETSDDLLRCLVCDEHIKNDDSALQVHVRGVNHEYIRRELHSAAERNFAEIQSRIHCDWYNVQKYWCVPCSANFENEARFARHLESARHASVVVGRENRGKTMIYDFCAPCALLWYGYRCTYAYHCNVTSHKWLLKDGHYVHPDLPEEAKKLLVSPERSVDDVVDRLSSRVAVERENERTLMRDLLDAVGSKFAAAEAHVFGSRANGLGAPGCDVDVFLDCGNRYDGNKKSERTAVTNLMSDVEKCLNENSKAWVVNGLLTDSRSPIIRANHRATGLACDIKVENGLSVENTKLVKSFNDIFPPCRKLTLFLKQWLGFCSLSGSDRISSYALSWLVIFYLQKETILPSVAALIAMNKKSRIIADWEIGVSHEFSYNEAASNYSMKEFLVRFFTFYANFDFRHEIACPLLGEVIAKRAFADHRKLPKEMAKYVAYMQKNEDPEPLRIDSAMCVQDPFDLQHNITKAVNKVFLCRFRTCCSKSLDQLCCS